MLSPIEDILADLRAGRMIILVDDENRENEGDLVCAAEKITPEIVHFMTRHTPGYLCIAMTGADLDRLELHPQTAVNTSLRSTAMAVSIDAHPRHGVGTGISASDRAKTVLVAVDERSGPDDLVRPGHMVPLRAREGGVLVRTGQTEGSVDLARLAGMRAAAVISEISRDADGEMARMPDLEVFAHEHGLKMCSVEQVIHYRLERERIVRRIEPTAGNEIETDHGVFRLFAYQSVVDPLPHIALTVGGVGAVNALGEIEEIDEPVLVRMHRRNVLGDIFGDRSQPTNRILAASMKRLVQEGRGALVYLRPSGVGEGLLGRLQSLQGTGESMRDSSDPALTSKDGVGTRAVPMDRRDFGVGGQILRDLGLTRLRVLTNHPVALHGLSAFGLEITQTVALPEAEM